MMNMIFDTHAHYYDKTFDLDRDQLLGSLPLKNVFAVINAGADIASSKESICTANKYPYIYAAVGFHPENIDGEPPPEDYISSLESLILNEKKVVAVGEIGLDYHFNRENKIHQKAVFEKQVQLAIKYGLPVVVHDREAHGDTLDILEKYHPRGVVHCFSGSIEMAQKVMNLGMYIGVGGVITFKNAKNILQVIEAIPLSHVVLETDAPYLAPEPFRGTRCDSSYIEYVAKKIAQIKNISENEVLSITKQNAIDLFRLRGGDTL